MTEPTPLEVAAALRATADFCRAPHSAKAHGTEAKNAKGDDVSPLSPDAVSWCAIGHIRRELRIECGDAAESLFVATEAVGMRGQACNLFLAFDRGVIEEDGYEEAAAMLEARAVEIEDALPVATRDGVAVSVT